MAIIAVDLLLAGDNAVVIALAARNLDPVWKGRAILWGTLFAVVVRVILVFFVSLLLKLPGVSLVGGLLLYGIAWKLINEDDKGHQERPAASNFWAAMSTIVIADTVMGLDNILAIAGAAQGDLTLIVFGLVLSIPIMMGGSVIILKALEKMPWLIIAGSALLSGIAGHIILKDAWVQEWLHLSKANSWILVLTVTLLVTAAALLWKRRRAAAG